MYIFTNWPQMDGPKYSSSDYSADPRVVLDNSTYPSVVQD